MSRKPSYWWDKHNKAWYTTDAGNRVRLADGPKNAKTEELARTAFFAYMSNKTARKPDKLRGPLTVTQLFQTYLAALKPDVSEKTFLDRKVLLEEFAAEENCRMANRLISSLIPFHLTSFLSARLERWPSNDTQAHAVAGIKAPFNWAVKQGLLGKSPFYGISKTYKNRRAPASEDNYRLVVDYFADLPRVQEVIRFLYLTGCRPTEIEGLTWQDIDLERGVLLLKKHKTSKKTNRSRQIVLVEEAVKLLIEVRKRQQVGDFVFLNHFKKPYRAARIRVLVRDACAALGIKGKLTPYQLRHSFGTAAIAAGVSLKVLAELMGHESTKMTEHYCHIQDLSLLKAQAELIRAKKSDPPSDSSQNKNKS